MDDVWNRRTPEQAARDAEHTRRMQQLNDARCYSCGGERDEHDRKHWAGLCHECGERIVDDTAPRMDGDL